MFKKNKQKELSQHNSSGSDKIAGKIALIGIRVQAKFSDTMNALFSSLTIKKIKIALIFFCLSAGGYSVYLVAKAITGSDKKQPIYKVDKVGVPKHLDKTGDELIVPENYIDEETFYKIQQFKKYIDSLKQMESSIYDSIITARPFLLDSILMLEEIYYSQKQNEVYELQSNHKFHSKK